MSPGAETPTSRPEDFRLLLDSDAPRFGLSLSENILAGLSRFLAELDLWRRRINLTGPIGREELVEHALESALGAKLIIDGKRVLDIGAGSGFPGVPLALCRPDVRVTLLEPRGKKAAFLRHVLRVVPVQNAEVLEQRAEGISAIFETATVRALGALPELLGGAPFLKPQGALLAWTTDAARLAEALGPLFCLETVERIPGSRQRLIAVLRKTDVPRGTTRD